MKYIAFILAIMLLIGLVGRDVLKNTSKLSTLRVHRNAPYLGLILQPSALRYTANVSTRGYYCTSAPRIHRKRPTRVTGQTSYTQFQGL